MNPPTIMLNEAPSMQDISCVSMKSVGTTESISTKSFGDASFGDVGKSSCRTIRGRRSSIRSSLRTSMSVSTKSAGGASCEYSAGSSSRRTLNGKAPSLRFGNVTIREYERKIDTATDVDLGLTIGWKFEESKPVDLDHLENSRKSIRKSYADPDLTDEMDRANILLAAGYSKDELRSAIEVKYAGVKDSFKVRFQRVIQKSKKKLFGKKQKKGGLQGRVSMSSGTSSRVLSSGTSSRVSMSSATSSRVLVGSGTSRR